MYIIRNEERFELTEEEMLQAYSEYSHRTDIEDIVMWINHNLKWYEFSEEEIEIIKEILNDDDTLDRLAYDKHEYESDQDAYDEPVDWRSAAEAVVCREMKDRKIERKYSNNDDQ